ncbi:hypothetical protein [Streptomyces sp. ISL-86]|uniref:hypothetical protein n=1 Tax=Streptomyces sp. ISL-86 TaxID=2819187 RepID=UPI001BE9AFE9|nr:hypothetical protein [Streptomyces sp. ISL-86]MBT2454017.1 hypothetical protein [Streptomyces sp. ISL-86]
MSVQPFEALSAPLLVLRLFASEFPHLPAPGVSVSTVYPDRLELSFHNDFAGFEAWRDVLGIAPENVSFHVQDGRARVLKTETHYAGAWLLLIGYAKDPASVLERSRAEVAS